MRLISIDILRSIAIILMVLVHFMENLAGSMWTPAGFGAPFFLFLVGMSYRIWLNAQERREVEEEEISRISIRRGLFLFGLGFAFNVLVWLPEDTYNWDVLTLIGSSLIILNLLRTIPLPISALIAVMAFLIAPVLRFQADYDAYWTNGYFECDLTLSDVLIGYFATGFFPLIPWIAYPISGYIIATVIFAEDGDTRMALRVGLIGVVMLAGSVLARQIPDHSAILGKALVSSEWTMFPPSISYMLGTLGMVILAFAFLHRWLDRYPRVVNHPTLKSLTTTFSKYSLSIYLLHHVVHLWPLWICGMLQGHETTYYWQNALPESVAVVLAILFLMLSFFLFRWMDRTDRRGVEGWMRSLCG
jgi:uncharacterized membrane protein